MLGDLFTTPGLWQSGSENEHFQVDYDQLSLIFIECPDMTNPDLKIVTLAKLFETGTIDQTSSDFQVILNEFLPDLEFLKEFMMESTSTSTTTATSPPTTTTTTTTTKAKVSPGFLFFSSLGIFILLGLRKRNQKK